MQKKSFSRVFIPLLLSFSFYQNVLAAGFQLNEVSPGLQGAALAGGAASNNDVSAMFFNPATLSTLLENQLYVGASAIFPRVNVSKATGIHTVNIPGFPPSSITATVLGNPSQNNITKWGFVPDGYLSWRVNEWMVAGVALTSPFGLVTEYDKNSVLRFAALKSELFTFNFNPALAFKLNSYLSIGLGAQLQYAFSTLSSFNGLYTGVTPIDDLVATKHPTKLHARGWAGGYTLGVLYQPFQCTRLGVGYRSGLRQELHGDGDQFVTQGSLVPAPSQTFPFNARTSVNTALHLPGVLVLSGAQDIQDWTVKASAQLNLWHSLETITIHMPEAYATSQTIQMHWKNSWLLSLGSDYRFTPSWTFRLGTAYDQTPTSHRYRDPRIPDADRYWLTGGFTHQINKNISVDGAYEHLFSKRVTVNVTQAAGSSATSTVPLEVNTVKANYKSSVDIFALALRYKFC